MQIVSCACFWRSHRTWAPDKAKAEKVLDYFLSDKGQAMWANAYLRPARPVTLPKSVQDKFLPESNYARAKSACSTSV